MGDVRKSLLAALAGAALVLSGCGSQGSPAPAAHGKDTTSPSPSSSPTSTVSKMRTCQMLFTGHSPLISRTLTMSMKGKRGKASDPDQVESTVAQLRKVAARTRPEWRGDLLAVASSLPKVTTGKFVKADYKAFQSAHHALVSHCSAYSD